MSHRARIDIVDEYRGAALPDARLNQRLCRIAEAVEGRPDAGFPQLFATEAELEAFYRFANNERVGWEEILAPHIERTLERSVPRDTILVAHDTTEFRFGGAKDREGLTRGRGGKKGGAKSDQGFWSHFALALDRSHHPLGVLGLYPWTRGEKSPTQRRVKEGKKYDPSGPSEQDRWGELIEEVEGRLGDLTNAVHVLDSEADDYALFARLVGKSRFVVRLCYDRVTESGDDGNKQRLREFLTTLPVKCEGDANVSANKQGANAARKRNRARRQRKARVAMSASPVTLRRPTPQPKALPGTITVNVVYVREIDPPADVEPLEWLLLTTEPIESPEQIQTVVDYYRGRWVIEEFFKAIKTGCAYEKRQLESFETLMVALAIFVPVAWGLLNLRTMARTLPDQPASRCLSSRQLTVLRLASTNDLQGTPTVREALLAVAKLGGHLKRNGEPGWQTLGRGFLELLRLEQGFILAQRCDQS